MLIWFAIDYRPIINTRKTLRSIDKRNNYSLIVTLHFLSGRVQRSERSNPNKVKPPHKGW